MPDNISDKIADKYTSHAVNLERVKSSLSKDALNFLNLLEIETIEQLKRFDPTGVNVSSFRSKRLNALIKEIESITKGFYGDARRVTESSLKPLVNIEGQFAINTIDGVVGVDIASVKFTPELINSIVSDTLIEGAPSKEWWTRQADNSIKRFSDEMRTGVGLGEDINTLSRRVRGTATGKRKTVTLKSGKKKIVSEFKGGFMDVDRRQADALVRTSVQAISNEARLQSFQQNDDIIRGLQALVTLDNRTSTICIARSGAEWDLKTGDPVKGTSESFPGPTPWHWQCRSTLIPILYDFDEMEGRVGANKKKRLNTLPQSTQASMDGQVAGDLTYEQWLGTKAESTQKEVLGPAKWELWQKDKLSFTELINQDGRPLTVAELEATI